MTADINLDRLERELEQAVEADRRYWEKNDAKFRAVNQRVASYEEFKEIVNASHLKPLDRGERVTEIRSNEAGLWNRGRSRGGAGVESRPAAGQSQAAESKAAAAEVSPTTSQQFLRQWRSLKAADERSAYLLRLSPSVYSTLFASEVPFGLLGEFFIAMDAAQKDSDWPANLAIEILATLSSCQRISLAVAFFSQSERSAAERLIKSLEEAQNETSDSIEQLKSVYLGGS